MQQQQLRSNNLELVKFAFNLVLNLLNGSIIYLAHQKKIVSICAQIRAKLAKSPRNFIDGKLVRFYII